MKKPVKLAVAALILIGGVVLFAMFTGRHVLFADPQKAAKQTAVFLLEKKRSGQVSQKESFREEDIARLAGKTSVVYMDYVGAGLLTAYFYGDMVIISSDVIFQSVEGFVYSEKPLASGQLKIPGSGYDGQQIRISPTDDPNVYRFSAGL
ncbi:MAG: hypothetical protein IJ071_02145 [Ruminococcus sp.]|nr:hypothetical protein [Ruminococcus sp.]